MFASPVFITSKDKTVAGDFSQQGLTEAVKTAFQIHKHLFIVFGFNLHDYELGIHGYFKFSSGGNFGEVTDQKSIISTKVAPCLILVDTQLEINKQSKQREMPFSTLLMHKILSF